EARARARLMETRSCSGGLCARRIWRCEPLQAAFAPNDVLVVPLDYPCLLQPSSQCFGLDLVGGGEPRLGGFEAALLGEPRLVERLPAPEEQSNATLQLAVPDDGVSLKKPDRVRVPYLALG